MWPTALTYTSRIRRSLSSTIFLTPVPSTAPISEPTQPWRCRYTTQLSDGARDPGTAVSRSTGVAGRQRGEKHIGQRKSTAVGSNHTPLGGQVPNATKKLESGGSIVSSHLESKSSTNLGLGLESSRWHRFEGIPRSHSLIGQSSLAPGRLPVSFNTINCVVVPATALHAILDFRP